MKMKRSGLIASESKLANEAENPMKIKHLGFGLFFLYVTTLCAAQTTQPAAILSRTFANYRIMQGYSADGTVSSDVDSGHGNRHFETPFTIKLEKPDYYVITWDEKMGDLPFTQAGAVWNAGSQPYVYMHMGPAMNAYAKMSDDQIALSTATGVSGEAASLIPSLFFPFGPQPDPFATLIDPKIEGSEKIDGDDCYKIGGSSIVFDSETFWISKSTYLVRKYQHSFQPSASASHMTKEQLDEAIAKMGPSTEAWKEKMEATMKKARIEKVKGFSTQVQLHITSPKLQLSDFAYKPPAGAVLKESLFGGASTQNGSP